MDETLQKRDEQRHFDYNHSRENGCALRSWLYPRPFDLNCVFTSETVDTSNTLFREYIMWRSKVIIYVAVFLVIIAVIGMALFVGSGATNINRVGLLLQFIGVLALGPDVIGKERFRRSAAKTIPDTGTEEEAVNSGQVEGEAPPGGENFDFMNYYQSHNGLIVVGNVLFSIAAMAWMAAPLLDPNAFQPLEDRLARTGLALLGFSWINLYMVIHILRLFGGAVPPWLLAGFFTLDLPISFSGMLFAAAAHILIRWVGRGLEFVFDNGVRRVLLVVTLPCLIVGLFLELLATFL